MLAVCGNVAAAVEPDFEIYQQPALYRASKPHRKQHKIRVELELGPGHPREVGSTIGEHLPLETDSVNPLNAAIVTGEFSGSDTPLPIASLLMRM
jgi:hypothetical protein